MKTDEFDTLEQIFHFVAPKVREAAVKTATQLEQLGIRYALVGGLAVGVYGYIRATQDVDFLVGEEAFEHHGLLVTFKAGVPIEVDGIKIDYLSTLPFGPQMEAVFEKATVSQGIPIVPLEALIYMKLVAKRRRDQLDIIELIKAGINLKPIRHYLTQYVSDLLPLFEELVAEAENYG